MLIRSNICCLLRLLMHCVKKYIDRRYVLLLQVYDELLWIIANRWSNSVQLNNEVPGTVALSPITIFVDLFPLTLKNPPFPVRIRILGLNMRHFCTATPQEQCMHFKCQYFSAHSVHILLFSRNMLSIK